MTYIEFFDKDAAENISASLACVPDRVIFIGHNSKVIKRHIENYKKVFSQRGENIEFLYRTVSRNNIESIQKLLLEIINTYDDCVFDISGGEEIYVFALGMICGKYPDKNIQIQKVNLNNNTVYDCDEAGKTVLGKRSYMSVAENVCIYGGDVVYGDINEEKTYEWDLSEDFTGDINIMWSVCKKNVKQWNLIIGVLGMMEKIGQVIYIENLKTVIKKSELKEYLEKRKIEYQLLKDMIDFLQEEKLVTFFCDSEEENITISYKNGQVKKCLTKAGLVLEMKIYITAKNIIDSDGAFVYDDVVNGAVIDWDSEFHNITDGEIDTENEIDVLMMHGTVPVFISCKNGMVNADELYKLNTVAERFGGENVKKILVATALSSLGGAEKYLRQRAEDMNIKILDDVHMLSDNELEEKIRNLWHG